MRTTKAKTPLRAAVIGTGFMGENHTRIYHQLDSAVLVGISDINPDLRSRVAGMYHTTGFVNHMDLVNVKRPDIASIATPSETHYDIARDLICAGVNVLVEKPLALTVGECKALIDLANENDVKLSVGHIERFNPVILRLKQMIAFYKLGHISHVVATRAGPPPKNGRKVGVVLDLAIHDIDIVPYIMGSRVKGLMAEIWSADDSEYDDYLLSIMELTCGARVLIDTNWMTPAPAKTRKITLYGTNGVLVADLLNKELYWNRNTRSVWDSEETIYYSINRYDALTSEIKWFITSVTHDKQPVVSGHDGLLAVKLAHQIIESAHGLNQLL